MKQTPKLTEAQIIDLLISESAYHLVANYRLIYDRGHDREIIPAKNLPTLRRMATKKKNPIVKFAEYCTNGIVFTEYGLALYTAEIRKRAAENVMRDYNHTAQYLAGLMEDSRRENYLKYCTKSFKRDGGSFVNCYPDWCILYHYYHDENGNTQKLSFHYEHETAAHNEYTLQQCEYDLTIAEIGSIPVCEVIAPDWK